MATIEIRSRDVKFPLPNHAQHMYIVYTNDAKEKMVLRGNQVHESIIGILFDDILVILESIRANGLGVFYQLQRVVYD
jgi:hypothetical protein